MTTKVSTSIPVAASKRRRAPLSLGSNSPSPPPSPRKRIKQSPAPIDLSKPRPPSRATSREPSAEPESRTGGLGYNVGASLGGQVIEEDEEEDYLTLELPKEEPKPKSRHPPPNLKSKAELHAQAAKARDLALQTSMMEEAAAAGGKSKGLKLLKAMGYVPGQGLGKEGKGAMEPITVKVRGKEDKRGVGGSATEEKEWFDDEKKLREVDVEGYRGRVASEKEMKRWEAMAWAGIGIYEQLCEKEGVKPEEGDRKHQIFVKLLKKDREAAEAEKKARDGYSRTVVEEDDEEEEPEVDEFKSKGAGEQLDIVVQALRERFNYCFWCKYQYEDDTMDGCPGGGEDGHG